MKGHKELTIEQKKTFKINRAICSICHEELNLMKEDFIWHDEKYNKIASSQEFLFTNYCYKNIAPQNRIYSHSQCYQKHQEIVNNPF